MAEIIAVFIPIIGIISLFFGVYFFLRFRNSERLALIEKAADPSMFKNGIKFKFPWMKFGLLLTGIGVGILVGSFLKGAFFMMADTAIVFSMFIFGGLAMVLSAKLDKNEKQGVE